MDTVQRDSAKSERQGSVGDQGGWGSAPRTRLVLEEHADGRDHSARGHRLQALGFVEGQ